MRTLNIYIYIFISMKEQHFLFLLSSPVFWRLTLTVKKHVSSRNCEEMFTCDVVIVCVLLYIVYNMAMLSINMHAYMCKQTHTYMHVRTHTHEHMHAHMLSH